MDGEQLGLSMRNIGTIIMFYLLSHQSLKADELPDAAFLEWLGQVAEIEELGVDVNELILQQELRTERAPSEEEAQ